MREENDENIKLFNLVNKIINKKGKSKKRKKMSEEDCLKCYNKKTCETIDNIFYRSMGRTHKSKARKKLFNQIINTCPKKCRKLSKKKIKESLIHLNDCDLIKNEKTYSNLFGNTMITQNSVTAAKTAATTAATTATKAATTTATTTTQATSSITNLTVVEKSDGYRDDMRRFTIKFTPRVSIGHFWQDTPPHAVSKIILTGFKNPGGKLWDDSKAIENAAEPIKMKGQSGKATVQYYDWIYNSTAGEITISANYFQATKFPANQEMEIAFTIDMPKDVTKIGNMIGVEIIGNGKSHSKWRNDSQGKVNSSLNTYFKGRASFTGGQVYPTVRKAATTTAKTAATTAATTTATKAASTATETSEKTTSVKVKKKKCIGPYTGRSIYGFPQYHFEAKNFKTHGYTDLETKETCELPETCDKVCYSKEGNYNDCKGYCYTENGTLNSCKYECDTKIENGMENCENNCGKYLKYSSDLPNCKHNCYTQNGKLKRCIRSCFSNSNEEGTLENCEYNCGTKENPVTVELPKCKEDCYTTHVNGAPKCTENCGTKKNPLNSYLDICRSNCYTTKDTKNKPLAGTRFIKSGTGLDCYNTYSCCAKTDYTDSSNLNCYKPVKGNNLDNFFYKMSLSSDQFLKNIMENFNREFSKYWVTRGKQKNNRFYYEINYKLEDTQNQIYTNEPKIKEIIDIDYFGKFNTGKPIYVDNKYKDYHMNKEWNPSWKRLLPTTNKSYRIFNIKLKYEVDSRSQWRGANESKIEIEDTFLYLVAENISGIANEGTFESPDKDDYTLQRMLNYSINVYNWYNADLTFRQNWNNYVEKEKPKFIFKFTKEPTKIMKNGKFLSITKDLE